MATIYCDAASGNDGNAGTTTTTKVRTLQRAMAQAVSGDTIIASGSTFAAPFNHRLDVKAGVIVKSASGRQVICAGTNISNGLTSPISDVSKSFDADSTGWTVRGTSAYGADNGQLYGAGSLLVVASKAQRF